MPIGNELDSHRLRTALLNFALSEELPATIFEELLTDATEGFGVSHAELSLMSDDVLWVKAEFGLGPSVPGNDLSVDVVTTALPLVINDAAQQPDLAERFAAVRDSGISFYAGVPLTTSDGLTMGAFCVWDTDPREPSDSDIRFLHQTARHAAALIEQHKALLDLRRERSVLAATGDLLAMIAEGLELSVVLNTLAVAVEAAMPQTLCSVLLVDGDILRSGVSPSLPSSYLAEFESVKIGPTAGSCGTAAYTGKTVIVSDIQSDHRWADYRDLAGAYGLHACWSVPIFGPGGHVLGTFALYYREVRRPTVTELEQLNRWMGLAEVAITRARDISALRTAATRDPLTGLANRGEALRRLQNFSVRAAAQGSCIGVLFIDLDQFKFVNDTLGHLVGDEFLKAVAARLSECAGSLNTVARFGGDEFLVLCPDLADPKAAEKLALEVVLALQIPMDIGGQAMSLSASIGVSVYGSPEQGYSLDPIGDADLAMYAAKRAGRNSVAIFTPDLRRGAVERLRLEAELNLALANSELSIAYQPIIDLQTGRVAATEAILRWTSPSRGEVPPSSFIPVAEDSGLISEMGEFTLRQACQQLARWRRESSAWATRGIWVNVTIRQLTQIQFPELVKSILSEAGLSADSLGLEVTESALINEVPHARDSLLTLRRIGVHVAIDDFGTGHSSLSQLKHLPVDALKIDQKFIADMGADPSDFKMVEAIVVLARSLGLMVIAEGVETTSQHQQLGDLGCRYAQGRLWTTTLSAADMSTFDEHLPRQRTALPGQGAPTSSAFTTAV